jgi:signal transduction histidine kinase/CheY-like chemotaxis protein
MERIALDAPEAPPSGRPTASIDLESLVHHRERVDVSLQLEHVHHRFQALAVEYLPVTRGDRVIGLCGRGQIGFYMGSRYGFAIFSKDSVETVMVPRPVIVRPDTPLHEVLERALRRVGDEFREDVILVDAAGALIGLIKVESLAQVQSRLVTEQMEALQAQHAMLRAQNLELFHANNAARQSHGLYTGLFASHTLGVALLDEASHLIECNDRLAALLGVAAPFRDAGPVAAWVVDADRPRFLDLLRAQPAGQAEGAETEFRFDIPRRGTRLIRVSAGWIKETGQICACFDDVTEQRALEQKMLRQEKQKLLDTLVGGIAHELNNKMAPILGFAELLRLEHNPQSSEYISLIANSVREAARIVRQLLELSKPTANAPRVMDLRTVAIETLAILKFQLMQTGCAVRSLLPAHPVPVLADAAQLKQVALNLAINALHAMEGRPSPTLTFEVQAGSTGAELVVADNGCGIKPEHLSRIFDPFFTTKGPERGTGLGLSVCFSIIRQYGGDIRAENLPEGGARFTVTLRLESGLALEPEREGTRHPFGSPPGGRVLVVEDELVIRRLLREILTSRMDCNVVMVNDAAEALATLARGEPFNLILSDIRMPKMNGLDFYRQVRADYPHLANRFAFVTGHVGERQLTAEISEWNVPVISKPFTFDRLAEVCVPILQTPL